MSARACPNPAHPRRAGLLITALILTAVIGIALASYLKLSAQMLRMSQRNVYLTAAVDLAEIGLEHGLWALNAAVEEKPGAWSGWEIEGGNASRSFDGFAYGGGVNGRVNVLVANYNSSGGSVVSRARITLHDGQVVEKWMRVTLAGRSLFSFGLLARDKISAAGGAEFDSWVSDPDNDDSTPPVPWSASVARSNIIIAAASTASSAVTLRPSAVVYGKVAVGTNSGASVTYGAQSGAGNNAAAGLYQDWGTKVGQKGAMPSGSHPYTAPDALITGITASFETADVPKGATLAGNYVLPRSVSGPPYYLSTESIGTTGATTILQMSKFTVEGAATVTIKGDVTLILTPTCVETFKVTASGKIALENGATLKIYTPGNIDISGAGVVNPSAPKSVQIWSTRPPGSLGQTINLGGSGNYSGIIYAPDAALSIPGGTNVFGAAVVYSASLTGSGKFHFDESLKKLGAGAGGSVRIESYSELGTPELRAPYLAALDF